LARPLHPLSAGGYSSPTDLISTLGYRVGIDSDGRYSGSSTASYQSNDCTGPALISSSFAGPGQLAGLGLSRALYYIPRTGATLVTNPTRNSRSTSSVVCEANVSAFVGDYYLAPVNVPATTGIDALSQPIGVSVNYVP
jgi:hypothetical protein